MAASAPRASNSEDCEEVYDSTEEDMTYDEKRDLILDLVKEPDMKVVNFIRIVEAREPKAIVRTGDNGMEIDFDKLHASTLRALDLKLKEYHAAIDEKTPKFRGLSKLTGVALQEKIVELERHIEKIDEYLDFNIDQKPTNESKKMRCSKGKHSEAKIKDLFVKYSLSGGDDNSNVANLSDSDSSGWTSSSEEESDVSELTTESSVSSTPDDSGRLSD